jgi:hypothetical protein
MRECTSSINTSTGLVVGMTRHTHRFGMYYSVEAVGSFESLVQFGERSRDKVSLDNFTVRDLVAECAVNSLILLIWPST